MPTDLTTKDGPNRRRAESADLLDSWSDSRIGRGGLRAIRANIERYLPRHPRERPKQYATRCEYIQWYNAYARTTKAVAALPFAKPPRQGGNIPDQLKDQLEDVDGKGTHLDLWARRLFEEGVAMGCVGGLVDAEPAPETTVTRKDEEAAGIRPYFVKVRAEDIISWKPSTVRGRTFDRLVLREVSTDDVAGSEFQVEDVTEYLVYRHEGGEHPISVQRYRETRATGMKGKAGLSVESRGEPRVIRNVDRIPFVPFLFGEPTSECTAAPPLLDLLDLNITHFRVVSDRLWLLHICSVPTPVRKGYKQTKPSAAGAGQAADAPAPRATQEFGGNVMMDVPSDGDFFWRAPPGDAFAPAREELQDIEKRMAAIGLAFLAAETRAAETAEAKRIDSAAQNATVSSMADVLDDGIEQMLALSAQMQKIAVRGTGGAWSGGEWQTSRDYADTVLSPLMIDAMSRLEQAGQLSLDTLWSVLTRGGVLPDDFDPKVERQRLFLMAGFRTPAISEDSDEDDDPPAEKAPAKASAPPSQRMAA